MKTILGRAAFVQFLAFLLWMAIPPGSHAQGNYRPVTAADLAGAKFNHYYDAQMKGVLPPDFHWTFTATNLTITVGKGPIPPDLINQLAKDVKDVKKIEAAWKLDAGSLVISDIKVDGKPTSTMCSLKAYRTAPTVIRIGKHQYVFVPAT